MSWFHFNLQDFSISFLSILFEGVPFMFLGTLLSGVIDAFVPAEQIEKILPSNRTAAIALSGLLGVVFPMCECGVVLVIRRLLRKGLPVSCGRTYLLAAPIVNPIVALSIFAAFRGQHPGMMTSLRLALGFARHERDAILALGMLIAPAATVYLCSDSFPAMFWGGALIGMFESCLGLFVSYWLNLPSGACIVLTLGSIFFLAYLFSPKYGAIPKLLRRHRHFHEVGTLK